MSASKLKIKDYSKAELAKKYLEMNRGSKKAGKSEQAEKLEKNGNAQGADARGEIKLNPDKGDGYEKSAELGQVKDASGKTMSEKELREWGKGFVEGWKSGGEDKKTEDGNKADGSDKSEAGKTNSKQDAETDKKIAAEKKKLKETKEAAKSGKGGSGESSATSDGKKTGSGLRKIFDAAIHKLETLPKKAKKKVDPNTPKQIAKDRDESINATNQADDAKEEAKEETDGIGVDSRQPNSQQAEAAGKKLSQNNASLNAALKGGVLNRRLKAVKSQKAPRKVNFQPQQAQAPTGANVGGDASLGQLQNAMGQRQNYANQLDGNQSGLSAAHEGAQNNLQQHDKKVAGLNALQNGFGKTAKAHGLKEKAHKQAGQALGKASGSLAKVAQVMGQVAKTLQGVANALRPIPYVGPALAAAVTKIAKVVGMIGKGLGMLSKVLGAAGKKQTGLGKQNQRIKDFNKGKEAETKSANAAAKSKRDESANQAKKLEQTSQTQDERKAENLEKMKELEAKIKEKGGEASVDGGDGSDKLKGQKKKKLKKKRRTKRVRRPSRRAASKAKAPAKTKPSKSSKSNAGGAGASTAAKPAGGKGHSAVPEAISSIAGGESKAASKVSAAKGGSAGNSGSSGNSSKDNSPMAVAKKVTGDDKKDKKGKKADKSKDPTKNLDNKKAENKKSTRKSKKKNNKKKTESKTKQKPEVKKQNQNQEQGKQKQTERDDKLKGLASELKNSLRENPQGATAAKGKLAEAYNELVSKKAPLSQEADAQVKKAMQLAKQKNVQGPELNGNAHIAENQTQDQKQERGFDGERKLNKLGKSKKKNPLQNRRAFGQRRIAQVQRGQQPQQATKAQQHNSNQHAQVNLVSSQASSGFAGIQSDNQNGRV